MAVSSGGALALGTASAFNGMLQDRMQYDYQLEQDLEYNQQNQENMNKANLAFQRMSALQNPSAIAAGARNAGFSPIAAVSGNFGAGSMVSAPPSNASVGRAQSPLASMAPIAQTLAQADLLRSEARKNNAEAQNVENTNKAYDDRQKALSSVMQNIVDEIEQNDGANLSESEKLTYNLIKSCNGVFSSGSVLAVEDYQGMLKKLQDAGANYYEKEYASRLKSTLLNNKAYEFEADMSSKQWQELCGKILKLSVEAQKMNAEILKTAVDTEKSASDIDVNRMTVDKLKTDIQKMLFDMNLSHNKDFVGLMSNGEFLKSALLLGYDFTKEFGFGAGLALGSRVGGAVPVKGVPTAKQHKQSRQKSIVIKQYNANNAFPRQRP